MASLVVLATLKKNLLDLPGDWDLSKGYDKDIAEEALKKWSAIHDVYQSISEVLATRPDYELLDDSYAMWLREVKGKNLMQPLELTEATEGVGEKLASVFDRPRHRRRLAMDMGRDRLPALGLPDTGGAANNFVGDVEDIRRTITGQAYGGMQVIAGDLVRLEAEYALV